MLFCTELLWAQGSAVLQSIDVTNLSGNRVQLRFQLSQAVPEPRSFTINNPARVVLDFFGTSSGLAEREQAIGVGVVESVTVLEGGDRTRASINLSSLVPFRVQRQGNLVVLTLGAEDGGVPTTSRQEVPGTLTGPVDVASQVNSVDFRRGAQGEGIISIELSNPATVVDVREEGSQIIADFIGSRLLRGQERRLDVTDFATPVLLIDAFNRDGDARVAIQPTGLYEYLAFQADNRYVIEVKPLAEEEVEDLQEQEFTGELLSLNFQDIEVRAVLQIIADFTGLNVVVSDTVQGNLTLRLQNVPWDQALDIILRTKGLSQRQNGNVIFIAPTEEITARERLELEAQNQIEELVPLRTELVQVNFAKAEDIRDLIDTERSGNREDELSILSPRGSAIADPRTNTILVKDIPSKLSEARELIARLDRPVRQVLIDSRVVIANDDFERDLGVQFGFTRNFRNGDGLGTVSGGLEATDSIINEGAANSQTTGNPFPVSVPALADRLGVALPVTNPTGTLALALLGKDYLLDLELSASQVEGQIEIVSNPRVITTDRREATVLQGSEIPFVTLEDGQPVVAFKEAFLELRVTPQITPNDRIIMDLVVTNDTQGQLVQTATGFEEPTIDRREVDTQVLVDNGETVVLGGVYEQTRNNSVIKVPLLGDLPILGRLFKSTSAEDDQSELLIFVTPTIINEGIAIR
ncbi:MAG: type IV pilus secretin PilQ [Candidatus Competibacterales bacterium]